MFGKKESMEMGGHETDAKMKVLEELREMAMGMMGDKVSSKMSPMDEKMKQVTVASDDPEGLEKGLEMAKEVIPGMEMSEGEEGDDMELDEIEAMIAELEDKKRKKMMSV